MSVRTKWVWTRTKLESVRIKCVLVCIRVECENVLQSFAIGKTPGNDGLPIEFYKTFWPTVGKILVQVFNEAYNAKEMSNSQKQAVITLIEKKDKDRTFLENWRPISLINVDFKIASKVITMRIIKVLPEIIHCNQTDYVQNRFIGEAVRSIIDIMDHTKNTNIAGMLLFIDFEKAFDSLEWNFLFNSLEIFGFGHSLIRWVKTFYSNISSCNINNGICTKYHSINRGVRQGDPLTPFRFIVVVELLAIAIRKSDDIRGVRIGDTESKIIQYADDLTATLSDVESAEALLTLLKHFETCSGLKVNYTKTKAMWIGSCSNETSSPLGLKWRKSVKALGIHFSYDTAEMTQKKLF